MCSRKIDKNCEFHKVYEKNKFQKKITFKKLGSNKGLKL